jgi:DNA-binding CsgD family transcriptional regulator
VRHGSVVSVGNAVDCCGYLCAATGRRAEAVTVWAAEAAGFQREGGFTFSTADQRRLHEAASEARQALGPARARTAEERGAAMSLATAAEYALMLTIPVPPQPQPPAGPRRLSARERELVTLVARGLTDA